MINDLELLRLSMEGSTEINITQLSRAMLFAMEKMSSRKAWEDLSFWQQSGMIAIEYDNLTKLAEESVS